MKKFKWFKACNLEQHLAQSDDMDFEEKVRSLLVGRKIVEINKIDDQTAGIVLDNGTELVAVGNHGCGGCANGWYYLDELNGCDNAITKVETCLDSSGWKDVYHLFVFADNKKINCLQFSGGDNGFYGTGYDLYVKVTKND